jgi:acyl-ACP thioesterase
VCLLSLSEVRAEVAVVDFAARSNKKGDSARPTLGSFPYVPVRDREARDALVPRPKAGRVFTHPANVGLSDTTITGRARLDAIARWLQDVAYLDVVDAGLEDRGSWVVRKLRMSIGAFPRLGESLVLDTWCSGASPLAAERRTSLTSEEGRIEAVATWVFLDNDSGRPKRLAPEFDAFYATSADGRRARTRLRHSSPPANADRREWGFRAADLDVAEHVNNAAYWEVAEELMASAPEPDSLDVEIEFREPALAGPAVVLSSNGALWITSPEGTLHASITGIAVG